MFAFNTLVSLVMAAASVSANCMHGTSLHRREVSAEGTVEVSNFGYNDLQGPLNWAALDPANSACATSQVQSPIVIDSTIPKAAEAPVCDFPSFEEAEFENLGTTLETIVTGTTTFAGKAFTLQQFHMHTPSEHRINDEYFPLEIHMVHEAEDGALAVIAIPFQLTEDGSTTELLTAVTQNIEAVRTPGTITKTGALDFGELTNAIQTKPLFQYTGSLTTPPCAEGLTFLVMEEPMAINVKTYNAIKSVIKFNARYSQNKLQQTNLIQVGAQKAELNCAAVAVPPVSPGAAVELQVEKKVEAEAPKVEAPKVEAPKVEAPKVEAPKVEAPKVEAPSHVAAPPPAQHEAAPQPPTQQHEAPAAVVAHPVAAPVAVPAAHDMAAADAAMKAAVQEHTKMVRRRRRAL